MAKITRAILMENSIQPFPNLIHNKGQLKYFIIARVQATLFYWFYWFYWGEAGGLGCIIHIKGSGMYLGLRTLGIYLNILEPGFPVPGRQPCFKYG